MRHVLSGARAPGRLTRRDPRHGPATVRCGGAIAGSWAVRPLAVAVLLVVIAACGKNEDPDVAADQTLPAIQTTSTFPTTLLTTTTQPRFYEVQPGDTLFDIAKAHGLPVEAIMQANGMTDANVLLAGQVIQLPLATEFTTTTLPRPTTIPPSTALPLVPTLAP